MDIQQGPILAVNPIQHLLESGLRGLGQNYPLVSWVMAHPLLAAIGILVSLALLQIILGSMSNLIKHLFISLIKSPYSLLKWLLGKRLVSTTNRSSSAKTQDRIMATLHRLEACKREQDQLLQELKKLIAEGNAPANVARPAATSLPTAAPVSKTSS